jgi:hypothetical protein
MKSKLKFILPLAAIALCSTGILIFSRGGSTTKASEPNYRSIGAKIGPQKNKPFTDTKCLAHSEFSLSREAFILRDTNHISPKGVPFRDVLVAVRSVAPHETYYTLQVIDYRKGECGAYFTTIGDEEESNPLSRLFPPKEAIEVQLLWDRWRLANIPNWRVKMQRMLDRPKVQLAKEEYLSLKQLGFKMPKKWQEIK